MNARHRLIHLTVWDCVFSPLRTIADVLRFVKEYDEMVAELIAVRAADKELVEKLQLVMVPGSVAVLSKDVAKRIVRGGLA